MATETKDAKEPPKDAKEPKEPPRDLAEGAEGDDVRKLQTALNKALSLDKTHALKVDGIFGPLTKAEVLAFQRACSLDQDGIVGPLTRAALDKALAPPVKEPPPAKE